MSGYFALGPRALRPEDAPATRVLLMSALGITPYVDRALEVLERAERGDDAEFRALVVERDGTVAGLALFGHWPGTDGGARLHLAVVAGAVTESDVGTRLLDAVAAAARADGSRYLMSELPDDPAIGPMAALLRANGFIEESRVPDFYRDGVALVFYRRSPLGPA